MNFPIFSLPCCERKMTFIAKLLPIVCLALIAVLEEKSTFIAILAAASLLLFDQPDRQALLF